MFLLLLLCVCKSPSSCIQNRRFYSARAHADALVIQRMETCGLRLWRCALLAFFLPHGVIRALGPDYHCRSERQGPGVKMEEKVYSQAGDERTTTLRPVCARIRIGWRDKRVKTCSIANEKVIKWEKRKRDGFRYSARKRARAKR